jgi:hypothetical protein
MSTRIFLFVYGTLLLMVACQPNTCPPDKKAMISTFNEFVNTTMRAKEFYTIKEWESKDKEFNQYLQICYPPLDTTLYLDERKAFWTDALRYYFKRYDNRVTTELLNNKNPNSKIMQMQIKSIWANPDEAFQQIFQEMTGLRFEEALDAVRDSNTSQ